MKFTLEMLQQKDVAFFFFFDVPSWITHTLFFSEEAKSTEHKIEEISTGHHDYISLFHTYSKSAITTNFRSLCRDKYGRGYKIAFELKVASNVNFKSCLPIRSISIFYRMKENRIQTLSYTVEDQKLSQEVCTYLSNCNKYILIKSISVCLSIEKLRYMPKRFVYKVCFFQPFNNNRALGKI